MSTSRNLGMSKSSLDRTRLKAVKKGNTASQGSVTMEGQDQNDDVHFKSGGIDENHEEIRHQMEIESVQGPSRSSAEYKRNPEKSKNKELETSDVTSPSQTKLGYPLKNRKLVLKRSIQEDESSEGEDIDIGSDYEAGDESNGEDESESEVEGSISSNGSAEEFQGSGEVPSRISKAGYVLRKCTTSAQKRNFYKESSDEKSDSESEDESDSETDPGEGFTSEDESDSETDPGEGFTSEDEKESKPSIVSKGSGVGKKGSDKAKRARGFLMKEFTLLENGTYQCKHCPSILTHKMSLSLHLFIHSSRRFKCPIQDCGKKFVQKVNRDSHVKKYHKKGSDFKCTLEVSGKGFDQKRLRKRVKTVHKIEMDFKCGICGKTFAINKELLKHISNEHMAAKKMEVARDISPSADIRPVINLEVFDSE